MSKPHAKNDKNARVGFQRNASAGVTASGLPRTKKVLGQHWLADDHIINAIVDAVDILPTDTVVEIGPGPGILTEPLAAKNPKQLTAIELDKRLAEALTTHFEALPHITIHRGDVLRFDYTTIAEGNQPFKVVGNLPYQITSLILFHLFGELDDAQHPWRHRIQSATLMVQREVADRLMAEPNTKGYNALSIYAQILCDIERVVNVPPKAFRPPPKVDSAVIKLTPLPALRYDISNPTRLRQLIKTAFQQRRKTLRNGLRSLLNDDLQAALFPHAQEGLERPLAELRPDAIPITTWVTLANAWHAYLESQ